MILNTSSITATTNSIVDTTTAKTTDSTTTLDADSKQKTSVIEPSTTKTSSTTMNDADVSKTESNEQSKDTSFKRDLYEAVQIYCYIRLLKIDFCLF